MKNKRIQIRLTEADYQIIKENLIDKNINVSQVVRDYLIEMATGEPKITTEKILEILNEEEILNSLAYKLDKKMRN